MGLTYNFHGKKGGLDLFSFLRSEGARALKNFHNKFFFAPGPPLQVFVNGPLGTIHKHLLGGLMQIGGP